ncbi:hypothetical protein LG284_07440 [Citricoccus nitrophenolicus]|uniref:hypothetical protein n=1 Tax=Citricoccus muralis TaxID=169134 RepID=UPI000E221AE9|nr:hypothetical protein [Citricoccus muralis]
MTSPHTFPLTFQDDLTARHEHGWHVESRHLTSEGLVLYVRCVGCGSLRVDIQGNQRLPPSALSREVGIRPPAWPGG